ncbi:hypothetical protein ACIFQM_18635 [Paenibacillus sp. NRS-1782]|uniref:hypothetical protein n=1 Tax=unclassified Paenibacillus TaxID=185978 RepID=UPI003D28873E
MKTFIAVLCIALLIAIKDLPGLYRKHRFKDMAVYIVILAFGAWFSTIAGESKETWSPLSLIEMIYKPVNNLFSHLFNL